MMNRATSAQLARSADVVRMVDELGDWAVGPAPIFRQLALAIARGIERGALAHGSRLPAERALAMAMSVSRGTAVAAYDLLVADGLVERRQGSGTFAIGPGSLGLPQGREGSALVARLVDRSAVATDVIDLSISVLHDASGLPDATISTGDLRKVVPDTGYSPWGLAGLRAAVAELVTDWGLDTAPGQVVITTGAQQAISAAAACWVRPGDVVIVEDPTYPGALSAFTAAGARLLGVPVDRHGVRPDALRGALSEHPSLVYLQSTLHSPTGVVLAESRRREIAALLADARVPLVEDLALSGLCWDRAPAPIAAHAPSAPIAVVGSLSKLFWGGLRLGFVRAPEPVALRFARVKATNDLGSSAVAQVLAERLLRAEDRSAFIAARNEELRQRYGVLASALRRALPSWTWTEPAGGLSIWVRLPDRVAEPFARAALRSGVAVATAAALSPVGAEGAGGGDGVRLSFSAPAEVLRAGVSRLATAWRDYCG
jgi:DNA-binding transcriptional MocR family regulator